MSQVSDYQRVTEKTPGAESPKLLIVNDLRDILGKFHAKKTPNFIGAIFFFVAYAGIFIPCSVKFSLNAKIG